MGLLLVLKPHLFTSLDNLVIITAVYYYRCSYTAACTDVMRKSILQTVLSMGRQHFTLTVCVLIWSRSIPARCGILTSKGTFQCYSYRVSRKVCMYRVWRDLDYESMLHLLGITQLSTRRQYLKLVPVVFPSRNFVPRSSAYLSSGNYNRTIVLIM